MCKLRKLLSRICLGVAFVATITSISACDVMEEQKVEEVASSEVLWTYDTGGRTTSSPVIYNDTIIFGGKGKTICALDIESKEEKWTYQLDFPIDNAPLVYEDKIIVTNMNSCIAIDGKTGEEVWSFKDKKFSGTPQETYSYHSASPVVYKDLIIFMGRSGDIAALDSKTGKEEWTYKVKDCADVRTTPGIVDNVMVFGDVKGNAYAVDLETQKTLWTQSVGRGYIHSAFAYKDYAYFGGRDAKVAALNIKNGKVEWAYADPMGSWFTGDIFEYNEKIYVPGSDNHKVSVFNYNSDKNSDSIRSAGNIFSKPAIDEESNTMYICDGDAYGDKFGHITAINLQSGEKIWQNTFNISSYSSPVVYKGVVYCMTIDGQLYAIKAVSK